MAATPFPVVSRKKALIYALLAGFVLVGMVLALTGCIDQPQRQSELNRGSSTGDTKVYTVNVSGAAVIYFPSGTGAATQPAVPVTAKFADAVNATQSVTSGSPAVTATPGGSLSGGAQAGGNPSASLPVTPTANVNLTPGAGATIPGVK